MLVSMKPGPIAFTRIPAGPSTRAAYLVSIQTPALDTEYAGAPASGCLAAIDAIVMIEPRFFRSSMTRDAACTASSVPVRLTSRTFCHSASRSSVKRRIGSGCSRACLAALRATISGWSLR